MRPGDVRVVLCCNVLCYVATFCATLQRRGCMAVCASELLPKNWGPTRWGRRQAGGRRSGRSPEALWAQRACTFVMGNVLACRTVDSAAWRAALRCWFMAQGCGCAERAGAPGGSGRSEREEASRAAHQAALDGAGERMKSRCGSHLAHRRFIPHWRIQHAHVQNHGAQPQRANARQRAHLVLPLLL